MQVSVNELNVTQKQILTKRVSIKRINLQLWTLFVLLKWETTSTSVLKTPAGFLPPWISLNAYYQKDKNEKVKIVQQDQCIAEAWNSIED